jgi:hypothetical protein
MFAYAILFHAIKSLFCFRLKSIKKYGNGRFMFNDALFFVNIASYC